MPVYKAPLRDMKFLLNEVFDYPGHYATLTSGENATPDIVDAILGECGKFCEEVLSPLYLSGDEEGCKLDNGEVTTPAGYRDAYQHYAMGGWQGLSAPEEYGGQGLPASMGLLKQEMMGTANWPFAMYPGLSLGAMNTIYLHGDEQQKQDYLVPLTEGHWGGTMCLTEPQCGTDLGQVKTKAEPQADGSYKITGTKIFISAGEHDMAENIVHIVLARLPGAPEGTKGISLFIVPKCLPNEDGSAGERNAVSCGSIEHKMGIHGNATCVMNFDGAKGWLIGPENKGLNCMFTFMNVARIGTAIQGLGAAELGFQGSLAYAKERLAMRSLSGPKNPEGIADPIIVHPDVRRMLLTQKAVAEGARALIYLTAQQADVVHSGKTEEERKAADEALGFLTPIAKAFLTEIGYEAANLGMQVFGGHGFISEWGMEQNVRDARIGMIYEGTTGIQALDLLGRKVLMTQGESLKGFTKQVHLFCKENAEDEQLKEFIEPLAAMNKEWGELTTKIGMSAMKNREEVGAASVDYLMYSGYAVFAYLWARMAKVALDTMAEGTSEEMFYNAKVQSARFYFKRLLPRTRTHAETMLAGADSLLDMPEEAFAI